MKRKTRYEVKSPLYGASVGSVITADDLKGCNIPALVEGGHLAVVTDTKPTAPIMKHKEPENGA